MPNNVIFVFGSNLAGRHGKGAALFAKKNYGAQYGVGVGRTGEAYAIPTKCKKLKTLPIEDVRVYIDVFCNYAQDNPSLMFAVTPVGTGLAGHDKREIWRAFKDFRMPANCYFTSSWLD